MECQLCEATIELTQKIEMTEDGKGICPKCQEELIKKHDIRKALVAFDLITPKIFKKYCAIPPEREYLQKFGAFIYGPVGTGKSVLAFRIARALVEQNHGQVHRVTAPEMLLDLKNFDEGKLKQKIIDLQHKDILIIDDLGSEKSSDFVSECLYNVINYRNEEQKHTIITSNKTLDDFDDRISSRILEMCKVIHYDGPDRRLQNG